MELLGKGVTALFGPFAMCKTKRLRCITGLTRALQGLLTVDGTVRQSNLLYIPTRRRPLGYAFQETDQSVCATELALLSALRRCARTI